MNNVKVIYILLSQKDLAKNSYRFKKYKITCKDKELNIILISKEMKKFLILNLNLQEYKIHDNLFKNLNTKIF